MDYKDLLSMMEYAGLSYSITQPHMKGEHVYSFSDEETDIQYFIRLIDSTLIVAFRGSDSKKDWQADLRFMKKRVPYDNKNSKIRVHSGFINRYKTPQIRQHILSYITKDIKKVIVLGHSYGAALATLCAVDIQYNHPSKDIEVALFGAPRVGNKAFQKSFDKRVYKTLRVENGNDIVTKVPLKWMGFRHVGVPIAVGKKRIPFLISFKQHHPSQYLGSIFKTLGCITVSKHNNGVFTNKT